MATLEFDEATHRYTHDGLWVPNVTSVTGRLEAFGHANKDDLEYARARGTAVHRAIELHLQDDLEWSSLDDVVRPYLDAFDNFRAVSGFSIRCSEKRVFSSNHRFAGTLDLEGEDWNDDLAIIDIKATATISPAAAIQTAAYRAARLEGTKKRKCKRYVLHLTPAKTRTWSIVEYHDHAGDFSVFLSILNVYNWMVKHKLERPDDGKRTTRAIG